MDFPGSFAPLSPGDNYIADLVHDDWLAPAVNASELTDFPDDAIAASLAAFSGRDDDDFDLAFLHDNRHQTRSPAMRASFSMNDLTVLQHQPVQHNMGGWNHKLVSVKPKLQSVPEGSTFTGGPLNLMPLPNGMHVSGTAVGSDSHMQPMQQHTDGLDISMDDFADLDTDPLSGLHKQVPSHTNTLTQQLQMTHMQPDSQMPGLDHNTGYGAASGLSQVNTMGIYQAPPMGMANGHHHLQGSQQGSQTFQPSQATGAHDNGSGSANTVGAGAHMQRRQASGLPLRKSQSAVELGSWRSFSCGDEFWDSETGEPTKAWKLTPEERMLRIQRYREKRLNRNFNPAVKYQCRKSLADTRPRVRGRFARNDDVGIVLPHETKKAQRERDRASGSSTDVLSSGGQTSSGGGTPAHMQMTSTGQGVGGSNGQGATSQMTAVFTAPAQQHPVAHQNGQYQAGSTISAPATLHGISMIGASPEPLLQPDLGLSMGMIGRHGGSSTAGLQQPGVSMLPPLLPSSFPPMPPPLTSPGCIFTSAGQRGVGSSGPAASTSSNMMYTGMMPAPYMSSGQTIFTGQTIFSGASLHVPGAGGYQPPSGTASAHPSISPPLCAVSPTASDSHSHSHSVGLSLGELSTGHSL